MLPPGLVAEPCQGNGVDVRATGALILKVIALFAAIPSTLEVKIA